MAQATLQDLKRELQDYYDEAKAILDLAKEEDREHTEEEQARLDALMDEQTGLIPVTEAKVAEKQKLQDRINAIAMQRLEQEPPTDPLIGVKARQRRLPAIPRMAKLTAFKDRGDLRAEDQAYRCGVWLRALKARVDPNRGIDERSEKLLAGWGIPIQAAQTEGDSSGGGYLVPDVLIATIIDNRERIGIARRVCDIVPMTSEKQDIPKVSSGLTVYSPGESNTITASDSAYERLELIATKRAVANQISGELAEDAVVNMTDRAVMEMARALALQEDDELVNGDGTSTYFREVGLLSSLGTAGLYVAGGSATSGSTAWSDITAADVTSAMGLLPSQYWEDGMTSIICSSQFYYSVLVRLMLAGGGNTIASIQEGDGPARFMGHPVIFTARMPTATAVTTTSMLFGNFNRGVIFGDRSGVRMAMSMEYAFLDDLITLRAISRYDIHVHEPGDASDAGAYTALRTATS